MSPKVKEENYIQVNSERIKEIAKQKNITMAYLSDCVGTVYRNFSRQLTKEIIRKDWLEIICDELDVSRDYFTDCSFEWNGYVPVRIDDFDSEEIQKDALGRFLKYSRYKYDENEIRKISSQTLNSISNFIVYIIENPEDGNKLIFDLLFNTEINHPIIRKDK